MKDTKRNLEDDAKSGASTSGTDTAQQKKTPKQKSVTIPGGAGAAGQIPIKGSDRKLEDDPLQPDV